MNKGPGPYVSLTMPLRLLALLPFLVACGRFLEMGSDAADGGSAANAAAAQQTGADGPALTTPDGAPLPALVLTSPKLAWSGQVHALALFASDHNERLAALSCTEDLRSCRALPLPKSDLPAPTSAVAAGGYAYTAGTTADGNVVLTRCDLAASTCASEEMAESDQADPALLVLPDGRLLVAVDDATTQHRLGAHVCAADLSGCVYTAPGAFGGLPVDTTHHPKVGLFDDGVQPRYHVVSTTGDGRLYTISCDLDGTDCLPRSKLATSAPGAPQAYGMAFDLPARTLTVASSTKGAATTSSWAVDFEDVVGHDAGAASAFVEATHVPNGVVLATAAGLVRCAADGSWCAPGTSWGTQGVEAATFDAAGSRAFGASTSGGLHLVKAVW